MCHFHYKKFDSCGDYGIEVSRVCDEALWRAGLRGVLQICIPRILERSLEWSGLDDREPPKPALFRGYDGFCEMCVTKFKLPCSILQRSYSDHELDYSRPWNSFSPDDLAPYVFFGGLTAQIPELLSLSDQFEAARMKQGPHAIFYRSLEQGTWSQLRKALPFTYQGEFQSDYSLDWDDTMKRLNISQGITGYDRGQVVYALQHGPHPRVVYNNIFRPRGMPLGYFRITVVNSCQQIVSQTRVQQATAARESCQQYKEYSDDSSLTTLTKTPDLSDMETTPVPESPSRASELSDTPRYDGSISTPRRSRTYRALQATEAGEQATALNLALSANSPSQNTEVPRDLSTNADASITHRLAAMRSAYKLKQEEIPMEPAQEGRGSKVPGPVAGLEQRSTAKSMDRPRRMAIAGQEGDEWRLKHLDQATESINATKSVIENIGQGPSPEQDSERRQQLKGSRAAPGNGTLAPATYYKAERAFKWKVFERPGYRLTPKAASGAVETQGRKGRGRRDGQQPQVLGANQKQPAQQPPAQQRIGRAQGQPAQPQEAVYISDDSDEDVKVEAHTRSTTQPETHLNPSTVRRLQDSGLLDRPRRR